MVTERRFFAFAALIFAAALWGSSFMIIQEVMTHDIWWMLAVRHFFGALGTFLLFRGKALTLRRADLELYFKIAVLIVLTFAPQSIGLQGTSVANSAVITALFVVLTPMAIFVMKRGKPTRFQWLGSLIGISAFLMMGWVQGFSTLNFSDFLTFITAIAVAFHTVYFSEAIVRADRLASVVFYQFLFSGLILLGIALFKSGVELPTFSGKEVLGLVYLGFFSMAIPYTLQAYAQRILGPIQVVLVISSEPLWAMAMANVFRGDPFSGIAILASGLLIMANFVAEIKPRR